MHAGKVAVRDVDAKSKPAGKDPHGWKREGIDLQKVAKETKGPRDD